MPPFTDLHTPSHIAPHTPFFITPQAQTIYFYAGTKWTASAHIITAVIGSGVLSLAWAVAQLGWVAGPIVMILFSLVTYYTSALLADYYRFGDPVTGKRNYTYMDAVVVNLGGDQVKLCGILQYFNLFGVVIGYTIAASISMTYVVLEDNSSCHISANPYMIIFGIAEIIISQIQNFDQIWCLSYVAAIMSFTYSTIGFSLGAAKVAENGKVKGSLTGIRIGMVTQTDLIWRTFQALGDISFAYFSSLNRTSWSVASFAVAIAAQTFQIPCGSDLKLHIRGN